VEYFLCFSFSIDYNLHLFLSFGLTLNSFINAFLTKDKIIIS
jgi:hypothetical protein